MRTFSVVRITLFALVTFCIAGSASAQVGIAITFGPPALPVYEQPPCPGDNFIWVPGYWAFDYDFDDYYWVPGTWVLAPEPGLLWTPGYWAWVDDRFVFYDGYWAPEVGFYGGIAYGFGYFGEGYVGGRWQEGRFFYNRSVTNVNTTIVHNVYNTTVNNITVTRVSYNGGEGGIVARPTPQQESVARQRHLPPIAAQMQQVQAARANRDLRATVNQGKPPVAATPEPGKFSGHEVVRAREAGAPYHRPTTRGMARQGDNAPNPRLENGQRPANEGRPSGNVVHPRDLPPPERPGPPNTGDAKRDREIQKQQEKMYAQQQKERQKLEQKQEREDQNLEKQRADEARKQQMEQRHQQQTQQMEQRHAQQRAQMQQRQPPEHRTEVRPPKQEHPN